MSAAERVVLLHGLSRTTRSMAAMARALRSAGYEVINRGYPSRRHSFADLVTQFRAFCQGLSPETKTHFVGHSLGGLIIRDGLCHPTPFPLGRIVLLGVPNRGILSVRRLQALPGLRRMPGLFGMIAHEMPRDAAWFSGIGWPAAEIGVIAGTRRFHPLNPSAWLNRWHHAPEDSDGTVELDSALSDRASATLMLDVAHTFMPSDPRVIAATVKFLREGWF